MGSGLNGVKIRFFSEKNDVKEIRVICHYGYLNDRYVDLQDRTYAILNIAEANEVKIYQKLSPVASFFSVGGYPELGKFNAVPGRYYEIRYCRSGLFWKAIAKEVAPF